jgi:hypothetical protein
MKNLSWIRRLQIWFNAATHRWDDDYDDGASDEFGFNKH